MNWFSSTKESVLCEMCKSPKSWCVCTDICFACKFYDMSTCRNPKSGNNRLTMTKTDYCSKFSKGKYKKPEKKS